MSATQTQMQSSANLYNLLEQALRRSATDKLPITVRDLWLQPDIRAKAKNSDQIRSALESLKKREFVLKQPIVDATGDKMAKIGYSWNLAQDKPLPAPSKMLGRQLKPVAPTNHNKPTKTLQQHLDKVDAGITAKVATDPAQPVPAASNTNKEIELVYEGVQIVIGKNPVSGRLRLVIDEVE